MSHFSVLVIAKNEEELAQKMLPFHEAESTGYDDYCEWVDDIHDEHLEQYNNETIECVFFNGKMLGSKYDENPVIQSMWKRSGIGHSSNDEFILKDGYDLADVPFSKRYNSFDEFMEDYCGYTKKNPSTGKFERWTNPNSKWDWYSVGGRWSGKLITKINGNEDTELSQNIDWQAMFDNEKRIRKNELNEFRRLYNECQDALSNVEEDKYNDWVSRNDKVKEILSPEQYVKASYAFEKMDWFMWGLDNVEKLLNSTEEEYSQPKGLSYAFIDFDGNWNQKGEMGWFGCDDPDKATVAYDAEWWSFVQNLPDGNRVYVVDCHI